MALVSPCRPLDEAERIATVIAAWVILLWTIAGYTIVFEGVPQPARGGEGLHPHRPSGPAVSVSCWETAPVVTGTVLHR